MRSSIPSIWKVERDIIARKSVTKPFFTNICRLQEKAMSYWFAYYNYRCCCLRLLGMVVTGLASGEPSRKAPDNVTNRLDAKSLYSVRLEMTEVTLLLSLIFRFPISSRENIHAFEVENITLLGRDCCFIPRFRMRFCFSS